jgi:hypothetical protein
MKNLIILLSLATLISCKKKPIEPTEVCPGGCNSEFTISSSSASLHSDGYWHVKHVGANYFTIKGNLTQLDPKYVVNKVPLVEVNFDSNYWVLFDTIQYTVPMYSYLSWYTDKQFNNPIPIGTYTYTLKNVADVHPPLNIVGYQINPHMCWDCPYTETLLGTSSRYTYTPEQKVFFDREMIGDTATIFIQTIFNSDIGEREVNNKQLKVIFE